MGQIISNNSLVTPINKRSFGQNSEVELKEPKETSLHYFDWPATSKQKLPSRLKSVVVHPFQAVPSTCQMKTFTAAARSSNSINSRPAITVHGLYKLKQILKVHSCLQVVLGTELKPSQNESQIGTFSAHLAMADSSCAPCDRSLGLGSYSYFRFRVPHRGTFLQGVHRPTQPFFR